MKYLWTGIIVSVLLLTAGTFVFAQDVMESPMGEAMEEPLAFGGAVLGTENASATVEAINAETRTVTLKDDMGKTLDVICGPEVRNFDQIAVGDQVDFAVSQYAEIIVIQNVDAIPAREDSVEIERAELGEKPAGTITASVKVVGVVEDIDYENRLATLKGPQRTVTVEAGPEAVNFDKVKVGDNVYIELTEETQITVKTPEVRM